MAQAQTAEDYKERMIDVLLYIQEHIDEELSLDTLASVASFSRYHFHRIFSAFTGESLAEHIRRLRLEKAAQKLGNTDIPITSIALDSGYETPSALTKAFKKRFQMSPSEFRAYMKKILCEKIYDEKEIAKMQPEFINLEDQQVVFVRKTGNYAKATAEAWGAICKFAYSNRIVDKEAKFIGISHDNPDITAPENLRYDACITIKNPITPKGEVGIQTIKGGKYAKFLHKGAYENFSDTYNYIFSKWVPENNIRLRDFSSFEIYLNRDPRRTKPENLRTEIYVPVE